MAGETGREGATPTPWENDLEMPSFPPLSRDLRVEVCIVGAGIAGLTTAYLLLEAGKTVAVLDDGPIAGGESGRTTAHLASALDDYFQEIERLHGERGSRLAAESHSAAIDQIEAIVRREGIDCDFARVDGYLFSPAGSSPHVIDQELEASTRAGLIVEALDHAPLPAFETGPCLRFANQAQMHPLRYLARLAEIVSARGGIIHCGTHVTSFEGGNPAVATTEAGFTVTADALVAATNVPVNNRYLLHTKLEPYRTYVIAARIPAGSVPKALFWDTLDPYHFVRIQPLRDGRGDDLLIIGGEDHKTGQADDFDARWARLEVWARERFPLMGEVEQEWSGQVVEPVDFLAYIGRNPMDHHNVFIATGDSGNGMTHGTIAGMLLRDLILGRSNPWASLYDPSRLTLKATGEFTRHNVNVLTQYTDWFVGSGITDESAVAPGTGATLQKGMRKIAVYREEDGTIHRHSAVCRHLGCAVRWNQGEKTWDCPCHGSRYDARGAVINGPAILGLEPDSETAAEPEEKRSTGE